MENPIADNELMEQVRGGQIERLGLLFERHQVKLFNFFLRLTRSHQLSEDLTQEVFLRLLKYRASFAPGSPFLPWLYGIARRLYYDASRARSREVSWDADAWEGRDEVVSPDPTPDMNADQRDEARVLTQALARLPLEKREVLVLSHLQHLRCEEIAQIVQCSPGAVRVRIHRALQALKVVLGRMPREKVV
jgi:RNA polymerase sigma factor (sigma-70 family)